jgi:hypothetical protein
MKGDSYQTCVILAHFESPESRWSIHPLLTSRAHDARPKLIDESHAPPPLQLAIQRFHWPGCVATRAAGESCIPKRDHCRRIPPGHTPANLVVRLRPVDVGLPAQPSPSSGAVELEKRVAVSEDMSEVDLEAGDGGAAWGRNVC